MEPIKVLVRLSCILITAGLISRVANAVSVTESTLTPEDRAKLRTQCPEDMKMSPFSDGLYYCYDSLKKKKLEPGFLFQPGPLGKVDARFENPKAPHSSEEETRKAQIDAFLLEFNARRTKNCPTDKCKLEYRTAREKLANIDNASWDPDSDEAYNDGKHALEIHDKCACAYEGGDLAQSLWENDAHYIKDGLERYERSPRLKESPEIFASYDKNYSWTSSPTKGCFQYASTDAMRPSVVLDRKKSKDDGFFCASVTEDIKKGMLSFECRWQGGDGRNFDYFKSKKSCESCVSGAQVCSNKGKAYSR